MTAPETGPVSGSQTGPATERAAGPHLSPPTEAGAGPDLPPPTGEPMAHDPELQRAVTGHEWQRLSRRMLLIHPINTLGSMIVPVAVLLFAGSRGSRDTWWLWGALGFTVLAMVAGVVTWFVTRYRFTDRQLQLRTGLLSRKVVTAPLDRIRSVDIESALLHRILGLAKVQVGTGVDDSKIELNGLTRDQAGELRTYLLRRSQVTPAGTPQAAGGDPRAGDGQQAQAGMPGVPDEDAKVAAAPSETAPDLDRGTTAYPPVPEQELARVDWGWLRYAPFSLSSLVIVAGAIGLFFQFSDDLQLDQVEIAENAWHWVVAQAVLTLTLLALVLIVVGWVVVSTATYVLNWWNLLLVREPNGNLRLTRGLLTTHSQTVERAKVRGVSMGEPFLLRFVRGAELDALATGVSSGTVTLLPPAPRAVVEAVGHELLEEEGPLTMDLTGHGPWARRRMHVQGQWGTLFWFALAAVPVWLVDRWWFATWPDWLPVAVLVGFGLLNALLAESAWRNLGHALSTRYLVVQSGAVVRTREVLERAGIIGWVIEQSFFQRRRGLSTVTVTTAAGSESLVVPNIPLPMAVDLADRASPGMLSDLVV